MRRLEFFAKLPTEAVYGYYAPAFTTGIVFNVVNLAIIGFLVFRLTGGRWANPYAAAA